MEKGMFYGGEVNLFDTESSDRIIIHLDELELDAEASTATQHVYKRKERKPKVWSEIKEINGYYPTCTGGFVKDGGNNSRYKHLTVLTEKHAKAMIAFAKISQLMPYYGWEAGMDSKYFLTYWPWCNNGTFKVCGQYGDMQAIGIIYPRFTENKYAFEFIQHEENVQLLKDLYMID